jgi:hypothetical protein
MGRFAVKCFKDGELDTAWIAMRDFAPGKKHTHSRAGSISVLASPGIVR